jgi:hypothetical protein
MGIMCVTKNEGNHFMSKENPLHANERLREERIRREWSQQKLADELGIAS